MILIVHETIFFIINEIIVKGKILNISLELLEL